VVETCKPRLGIEVRDSASQTMESVMETETKGQERGHTVENNMSLAPKEVESEDEPHGGN
jgi:hypothetical protein